MRESRPNAARGAVNLDVHGSLQHADIASQQANPTQGQAGRSINRQGDAHETLYSLEFERQRRQLLEEDSQIDEEYANSQLAQRTTIDLTSEPKNNTPYSQLAALSGPQVSETQLQGLFDDTQFDKGLKKPASPVGQKGTQGLHGHPSQSQTQGTQYFDDLKNKLAEEESQVESQVEPVVAKVQRQGWTFTNVDKEVESERELVKEPEKRTEKIPFQVDELQFIGNLRAQFLDSQAEDSQGDTSNLKSHFAREKTILTETSKETRGAETQGSDQVVLFPLGTSFSGGQGEIQLFSQSQSQSQNVDLSVPIDASESQDRASQVPTSLVHVDDNVRQPGSGPPNLNPLSAKPSSTSHNPSNTTITNASAQPIITERIASTTSTQTRKISLEKLKGRAMDDWQRDSLGTASQTQENSGPRYGLAPVSQDDGSSITKKSRSSATQLRCGGSNVNVDRTYNENESGAVRLGLTQSQTQDSQMLGGELAASQDQGMRSPSYDFARQTRAVDDTSQLEPETPATTRKNPFRKSGTGADAPMGMSQVFAATQSSPLDPRFVQESDGLRPSSPSIGLTSSPIARRPPQEEKGSQEMEASSPSYINLAVASSFQPFDESTQPEAIRKANAPKAKSPTPVRKEIRREVAEKYKARIDAAEIRESQEVRRRTREAAEEARIVEARRKAILEDDGMDIEKENRARIAKKRQEEATERNLRDVGDIMGPRKEEKPVLDRVRRAASTNKVIVKNPVRENRLKGKSEERNSSPKGQTPVLAPGQAPAKRIEEVEVPASGEAAKAKEKTPPKKKSRHSRTPSEECRAQSEGTDARVTQSTESQIIRSSQILRSSAPHSSQQEVVADSQNNISTQAMTDHNSLPLEEVQDSYQPPSSRRPKSKLNRTSSAILPTHGKEGSGLFVSQTSQPAGSVSIPVTSSSHYLKADQTTPGSTKSSNETAPEVVPETSPASKTSSPEKLPFGDLDMVDDTPMPSFSDMRMTQEAPDPSDITPGKFEKRPYGKKSPVKKRPEQIGPGRGVRINFSEVPSDEEVEVDKTKRKKSLHPGHQLAKTKEPVKSARFVTEDDEDEGEAEPSPVPKKNRRVKGNQAVEREKMMPIDRISATPVEDDEEPDASPSPVPRRSSRANGKQTETPKPVPAPKALEPPVGDGDDKVDANALATPQELGRPRRTYKKSIPYKPAAKPIAPAAKASPQSSPIRPAVPPGRRSARRQPSDLKNAAALATAQATSRDVDMQEDIDDDAPIARPTLSKRRIDDTVLNTSDTEMANTSPIKSAPKLAGTPPFLPPLDDSDEDESVSPIRQSIENQKLTVCPMYVMDRPCKKDHLKDGLSHDPVMKALSEKRRLASKIPSDVPTDIPSTAGPGRSASPIPSTGRDMPSASAFARPDPSAEAHLPPAATGGRTKIDAQSRQQPDPQPQTNSEYAIAQSSIPARRFSIESSPLSDLNSELAEELEEFHTVKDAETAKAGPSRQSTRESTAMSDATLMPPPQTVSRQLDFVAPAPPVETPALPPTGKNKRSASTSGSRGKKAAKTTPDDTPSRSRRATRSTSLAATSSNNEANDDGDDTIVVRDTPRVTPTRRAGRQASRPSYAESPSTDGDDTAVTAPKTATMASRTPPPFTAVASGLQPDELNHSLFKGMAFAVSYKESTREGVKDREEIEALIVEHGGQLIDDFKDLFEKVDTSMVAIPAISRANSSANLASANTSMAGPLRRASLPPGRQPSVDAHPDNGASASCDLMLTEKAKKLGFVALIGDAPTRKSKFLQSLALSLPCLDSRWIRCCIEKNCIMAWKLFLLSSGFAHKLHEMDCTRDLVPYPAKTAHFEETFEGRKKMLVGMGVLFLIVKSSMKKAQKEVLGAKKEHYLWLTRALGAREIRRVKDVKEANELLWDGGRGDGNGWDVVYVDDGEKLATYRAQILGARWYEDGQQSEAEEEQVEEDDDNDLPIIPSKSIGKAQATAPKSNVKTKKAASPSVDVDGNVEMLDAEDDEDTQPAEPKEKRKSEEKKIRVVSDEFVVQSLILGGLEDEDLVDKE